MKKVWYNDTKVVILMKLNTHDRTPRPTISTPIKGLFILCVVFIFSLFGLGSFACFYYAQSVIAGVSLLLIPVLLTAIILLHIKDMEKAYVEIHENDIYVVDYYWGIKKEKHVSFSDITSAEIHIGRSHKVKSHRFSAAGMRYIVFKKDNQYLFKIIALPETEEIFKQYIK
ncbi:MAG: hypothetical protein IKM34_03515 [Clostridia bacterium]|nr:hypothetical protein [Clostridia bacterium]